MEKPTLHVETQGSGAPLLLIHGWGMHSGMWGGVARRLAEHFCVLTVDLPGHGNSRGPRIGERIQKMARVALLDGIVDMMSAQFDEPLTVCGWSLGGQIALRWSLRHPHQISRLIVVSSTPCFVRQPDWHCALPPETLAEFATALLDNCTQTLRRFLALQVRGSERERELLQELRHALLRRGEAQLESLQLGLDILRETDLRCELPEIHQPTLLVAGARDTLTPLAASQYMAARMPDARLAAIEGAAHAPFLSHPDKFMEHTMGFLHE